VSARLVIDVDGDGKDDIALTRSSNWLSIPVAFSNSDGSFSLTNQNVANFPALSAATGAQRLAARY